MQGLIRPEFIPSMGTIYRFLHNNNLMIKLKNRKKSNIKFHANIETNKLWIRELEQGGKSLNDLKLELKGRLPCKDIAIMYDCILNKPIRNRKRSLGVLSI